MSDDRQVDRLREVIAAFNRHDLDAIMSHFRDDCVFDAHAWARTRRPPLRGQGGSPPRPCGSTRGDPERPLRRRGSFRLWRSRRVGVDDHGHDRRRCLDRRARM